MLPRSFCFLYLSAKKVLPLGSSCFYSSANILEPSCHLLELLQLSIDARSLKLVQQCHGRICSFGFGQNTFLATKLISGYSRCGLPGDALLVFESVREKNVFLCNSLICGYGRNHAFQEALELFNQISRENEIMPDDFTFATLLKISAELQRSDVGEVIHCNCIRMGFVSDTVVANSLMTLYKKSDNLKSVRKVFEEMAHRSCASWNVLISGYAKSLELECDEDPWGLVKQMLREGVRPDAFTVSILLPLCGSNIGKWDYGREIHCFIIRNVLTLDSDVHIGSCLIDMYSKGGNVMIGRRVFDQMNSKNVVAWTAMISGFVQNGEPKEALLLFYEMHLRHGIEPNRVSLLTVLPACSSLAGLMEGKQIHGFAIRKDITNEVSLRNALIDMYSKCGSLVYARRVFDDDSCKDTVTWSSMIAGYGLYGKGQEAIALFNDMLQKGIELDDIVLVGALSACVRSGLVSEGLDIYNSGMTNGILPTVEISACVVDLLGRSGHLNQALDFIYEMRVKPGPSVWGALFAASVTHGNLKMQDLASRSLVQLEPKNPSNYVSVSNVHASSGNWDVVAEVRTTMKEKGLSKLPGCSWICINGETHSFYVADKSHPCSNHIYKMLDEVISAMRGTEFIDGSENLTQIYGAI